MQQRFLTWAAQEILTLTSGDDLGAAARHLQKVGVLQARRIEAPSSEYAHIWDWFLSWARCQVTLSSDQPVTDILRDIEMMAGVPLRPRERQLITRLICQLRGATADHSPNAKRPRPLFL